MEYSLIFNPDKKIPLISKPSQEAVRLFIGKGKYNVITDGQDRDALDRFIISFDWFCKISGKNVKELESEYIHFHWKIFETLNYGRDTGNIS